MARRRELSGIIVVAVLLAAAAAWAEQAAPGSMAAGPGSAPASEAVAPQRGFLSLILFWSGAAVVMALVARVVFREHLNERRTLHMLREHIGKVYPDFHPVQITHWVNLASAHVWTAWRAQAIGELEDFTTVAFRARLEARFASQRAANQTHEARLGKVLKVHMLGMYPDGEGPSPKDLALVLRVETRAVDALRGPGGALASGRAGERQVQHFWTLRHDGRRWLLDEIEVAQGDRTDLASKPPVPPLMEWRRDLD